MASTSLHITIEQELRDKIEHLRGMVSVSRFTSYLIKLGLDEYHRLHSQKIDVEKET